ncbi:MAG: 3-hydroxyacyl-CoA dehydrogenase NAD-binding domain-containing protein [Alphaproteobacteria bacterium]
MLDYKLDGDGIVTITWNHPERPVNVLNLAIGKQYAALVDKIIADPAVKGVILASAKSNFIVGAELESFGEKKDVAGTMEVFTLFAATSRKMETKGKPFVAAINGTALGGGYEIALACHRRICADNPNTRIGLPEVTMGLLPGGGGTQRLSRMLGARAALPVLMEGRRYKLDEALKLKLIDEIVPKDKLLDACKAWLLANPHAKQPWDEKGWRVPGGEPQSPSGIQTFMGATALTRAKTWGNYPAPQAILSCVYEGLQVPIEAGLRIEARYITKLVLTPSTQAMIRTLFFSMQDAKKLRRRPNNVPKASFSKIGVLGAGMMGSGIAYVTALAGLDVVLLDSTKELADKGKAYSEKLLAGRVAKGAMTQDAANAILARIRTTADYADLKGSELVIEAVFEDRAIKAKVTKQTEAVISADAIFASNTSTLPITGLATESSRPQNFIGLHFFSPVDKMPLVEIIRAGKTGDSCLAKSMDFVARIGMTPIVVNDSRGFFTSRVFATYVLEGLSLLKEGVKPALIENGARLAGMPVGPLAVVDETSLSLLWSILKQAKKDLGGKYVPHPAEDVLGLFVETLNRPGKKAGKGFYEYPKEGAKFLWPDLGKHFPLASQQPDVEDVKRRLLHIQAVETLRCLDENVVTEPRDADVGSILGWGFPAYTGGAASYVDSIGAQRLKEECEALAAKLGNRFAPPQRLLDLARQGALLVA